MFRCPHVHVHMQERDVLICLLITSTKIYLHFCDGYSLFMFEYGEPLLEAVSIRCGKGEMDTNKRDLLGMPIF